VATFVATSHELLRLWLYLPLQVEAVVRGFHPEFENGLITQQKKEESLAYSKTSNHQDFLMRKMRLWLHLPLQAKVVWLHLQLQAKAVARGFHAELKNGLIT
jgi:hypothetical protein